MATTWYLAGAVTMNSLVALSYGWSIIGSHWRALFGQFSLKNTRSPNLFFSIRSPLAGTPRYRTVIVSLLAGAWRRRQVEHESIGLVPERDGRSGRRHVRDGHPLAVGRRRQVQRDGRDACAGEAQEDGRRPRDLVALVTERELKGVVHRVDERLARVRVGSGVRCGDGQRSQRREQVFHRVRPQKAS